MYDIKAAGREARGGLDEEEGQGADHVTVRLQVAERRATLRFLVDFPFRPGEIQYASSTTARHARVDFGAAGMGGRNETDEPKFDALDGRAGAGSAHTCPYSPTVEAICGGTS